MKITKKIILQTLAIGGMTISLPAMAETLYVTKYDDTNDGLCDSDCSLREAVIHANATTAPDVIVLQTGTYTLSLPDMEEPEDNEAQAGDIDITSDIKIIGKGANATIINDELPFMVDYQRTTSLRHFDIKQTGALALNKLTLKKGGISDEIYQGGTIFNQGDLSLTKVIIDEVASFSLRPICYISGGAIYNSGNLEAREVEFKNIKFTNDTRCYLMRATKTIHGGALYNAGEATLYRATFSNNFINAGVGAAILNSHNLVMRDSIIHNNHNDVGLVTPLTNKLLGSGALTNYGYADLRRMSFAYNTTGTWGAAITNHGGLKVVSSTIFGNKSNGLFGYPSEPNADYYGGGAVYNVGTARFTNATIVGNLGGGVATSGSLAFKNSIVAGNEAGTASADCLLKDSGKIHWYNSLTSSSDNDNCGLTQDINADDVFISLLDEPQTSSNGMVFLLPLFGGAAVDAGFQCPQFDQLKHAVSGGGDACDIGAIEKLYD